jgi:trehalose synthase
LEEADVVVIHDPQPAPLLMLCPNRRGRWIWRCHIDASSPRRSVWKYLRRWIEPYDASIYSLPDFAQRLAHPQYLVPPSIDPLSDKNVDLEDAEIAAVVERFELDPERPIVLQVSRFDRFKDPLGVLQAYQLAKHHVPGLQLVLAGGGASDDPEGEAVLAEVRAAAGDDRDAKVLLLPADAHRTINALQRAATIVLQKSTREGFGLTVTEALWKGKPVIGGDVGGIRLQVIDHHTGFRVSTPEGAALRIRYLLQSAELRTEMGRKARELVRENFLLTRHLREYLTLMVALLHDSKERIEL